MILDRKEQLIQDKNIKAQFCESIIFCNGVKLGSNSMKKIPHPGIQQNTSQFNHEQVQRPNQQINIQNIPKLNNVQVQNKNLQVQTPRERNFLIHNVKTSRNQVNQHNQQNYCYTLRNYPQKTQQIFSLQTDQQKVIPQSAIKKFQPINSANLQQNQQEENKISQEIENETQQQPQICQTNTQQNQTKQPTHPQNNQIIQENQSCIVFQRLNPNLQFNQPKELFHKQKMFQQRPSQPIQQHHALLTPRHQYNHSNAQPYIVQRF